MAKRITPAPASDSTVCGAHGVADGLATSSLDWAMPSRAVIDRSLAPPQAPFAVTMPPCEKTACKARRQAVVAESDQADVFTDLIAPACWSAMTEEDRSCLRVQAMPTARLAIDQVSAGLARTVEPGFEDVARVWSPNQRAEVMLALGWLTGTCGCLRALMNSLPDDSLQGVYVRAGSMPQTPDQRAEIEYAKQRQRQRSRAWSAHLKAKAEARRRPPVGDLFGAFDARNASKPQPSARLAP